MQLTITTDQLIDAAKELGQDEFSRDDVATKLDVQKSDLKQAFKQARENGRIEKTGEDEDSKGVFRLT